MMNHYKSHCCELEKGKSQPVEHWLRECFYNEDILPLIFHVVQKQENKGSVQVHGR